MTTNVIPLYSAPIQGSIKYHIRGGTNQTSRSPFRRRWHTEEFEQRRRMDDIQASERACWFSSSIVFANALIEQVELTVTVWQGNWAEIASTQVYMCEKHTHTQLCAYTVFLLPWYYTSGVDVSSNGSFILRNIFALKNMRPIMPAPAFSLNLSCFLLSSPYSSVHHRERTLCIFKISFKELQKYYFPWWICKPYCRWPRGNWSQTHLFHAKSLFMNQTAVSYNSSTIIWLWIMLIFIDTKIKACLKGKKMNEFSFDLL